ncbi:MAG: N-acetyltransferase family protein [Halolamina sp.]
MSLRERAVEAIGRLWPARTVRKLVAWVRPSRIAPTSPPRTITDDEGREVHIRPYRDDDFDPLVTMYDEFDTRQRAQGVPPVRTEDIEEWVESLLPGVNAVAVADDRIVGHVTFVPDDTGRHELAIFVHQSYQGAGVGSALLSTGLGYAAEQGVEYVWLSVEAGKRGIQRWYARAGFSTVNPMGSAHRMSQVL